MYSQAYPTPGSKDFDFFAIEIMGSKSEKMPGKVKTLPMRMTLVEIHGPRRAGEEFGMGKKGSREDEDFLWTV